MINENYVISKSRSLLAMKNSGYTLGEFKILDIYLSRINPKDPKTAEVHITKQEYCQAMDIKTGKIRSEQLKKYVKHFLGNVVEIPRPDGKIGWEQDVLFTKAQYDEQDEIITLKCNPDPIIFNIFFNVHNIGYVRYILKNTLYLKSLYSYKLYIFIKSKHPATEFRIELPELKEKLEITAKRYEQFKFLNQEILKPCVEEICEYTDTYVEYEKIQVGNLTKAIKFKIKKQPLKEHRMLMEVQADNAVMDATDEKNKITLLWEVMGGESGPYTFADIEKFMFIYKSRNLYPEVDLSDPEEKQDYQMWYNTEYKNDFLEIYLEIKKRSTKTKISSWANYTESVFKQYEFSEKCYNKIKETAITNKGKKVIEQREYDMNALENQLLTIH